MNINKLHIFSLAAIILFAVFIRSINIGSFGLYGDEKYSIMVVNGISWEGATQQEIFAKDSTGAFLTKYFTPQQFWKKFTLTDFDEAIIRTDNGNSATFYGFLYLWKSVFGQSDAALRWMGVMFDCLTILLLFLFCKNILNLPWVGVLAGFFASIEPFLIAYSHQVRNYPVGVFLTLLSIYLFFKILKAQAENKEKWALFVGYGIVVLLAILTHFYVVLFVFCHFIFLVINYLRKLKLLKSFIFTYIFSFTFLLLWFTVGSGRNTFQTLKSKDEVYLNIAKSASEKNIETSYITLTNITNVKNKIIPIFADSFIFSNNLADKFNGKLNWILWVVLTLLLVFLLDLSSNEHLQNRNWQYLILGTAGMVVFYFLFSHNSLYYIYLSVFVCMLLQLIRLAFTLPNWRFRFMQFAIISIFLPIFITIIAAYRAGHTGNIYQKYLSFGLPISFILMALGIFQLYRFKSYLAYSFLLVLAVFLVNIYKIDSAILKDNYMKYTILAKPRQPNPYILVSQKLQKMYQPGDTIIYPNGGHTSFDKFDPQMKKDYVSVVDAQIANLYLPKNANYFQRIEPNEPDKVYLYQLKTNKRLQIFDFEGKKFRY